MTYPINAAEYIEEARRVGIKITEWMERFYHEEIIPLVNASYQDGRDGSSVYPLDVEEWLAHFEQRRGQPLDEWGRQVFTSLVDWLNAAYDRGRKGGTK